MCIGHQVEFPHNPDENRVEEQIHAMQRELRERGYESDVIQLLAKAIANTGLPLHKVVGVKFRQGRTTGNC